MKSSINPNAKQVKALVLHNKKIGIYHHILLQVGELATKVLPGNFIAISIGDANSSSVLRRAFAIYRSNGEGASGGSIEIIVSPHGIGSNWVSKVQVNDHLSVTLPLGNSFRAPSTPSKTILVGGGYGSAPLFALGNMLKNKGHRVDMVIGASTAQKIFAPMDGKRTVDSLTIVTEDGTSGIAGRVTDILPSIIEKNQSEVIYSCGPMPMMKAITDISKKFNIYHHASIEESMACGIGICMVCVIPIFDESIGAYRMERTCISGPIVDAETVAWDSIRKLPDGTLGHDRF
jgi:dihydroorotate dehydrogenase electron transfer subunit